MALSTDLKLFYRFAVDKSLSATAGLGPDLTFTNSSGNRSYYDSSGTLVYAAANEARFDHDPSNNTSLGLLIEDTSTNTVQRSEELDNGIWTKTNATITATNGTAPDGTSTADTADDSSASEGSVVQTGGTAPNNSETWCGSIYIEKDSTAKTTRFVALRVQFSGGTSAESYVGLDTSTGETAASAATGGGSVWASGAEDAGTHWRLWLALTNNATANTAVSLGLFPARGDNTDLTTADATVQGSCIAWGAQLEERNYPSSYIATTTASVNRAADVCLTTDVSWYDVGDNPGTFYIDAHSPGAGPQQLSTLTHLDDNSLNNRWQQASDFLGGFQRHQWLMRAVSGTTFINTRAGLGATTWNDGARHRSAWAWDVSGSADAIAYVDGGAGTRDSSYTLPDAVSHFRIGRRENTANVMPRFHVVELRYYNTRRSDSNLEAMSLGNVAETLPAGGGSTLSLAEQRRLERLQLIRRDDEEIIRAIMAVVNNG